MLQVGPTADDNNLLELPLTKEAAEEQSSSSPEELVPEVAEVAGAAGVRNLLERDSRERSSSGEEWEKVSDPNLHYTVN